MRLISPLVQIVFSSAFLALTVLAQVPSYIGQLLLQPGLGNGKCLTASYSDGAEVAIQSCTGSPNQKWTFTGGMVQVFGHKCLGVPKNADAVNVQTLNCSADNNATQWNYDKWVNRLELTKTGKCLDVPDDKLEDGARIQILPCSNGSHQVWNTGYMSKNLPHTSQDEQFGFNNCSGKNDGKSDGNSNCQTAWMNSVEDFCVFAPPTMSTVGDAERRAVAYCTNSTHGSRVIPNDTLDGVHFLTTPEYVQVTGVGKFTKVNIPAGDDGGELDNRGADAKGNPIGGLVYGNSFGKGQQYHEWTSFISDKIFCFRACVGANATRLCNHVYDRMGCGWNMPANYEAGVFEECIGDVATPMGVYGTSTWSQGVDPTPTAHPAPSSSSCRTIPTVTPG